MELVAHQAQPASQEDRKMIQLEILSQEATLFLRSHMRRETRPSAALPKKCPLVPTPRSQWISATLSAINQTTTQLKITTSLGLKGEPPKASPKHMAITLLHTDIKSPQPQIPAKNRLIAEIALYSIRKSWRNDLMLAAISFIKSSNSNNRL